MMNHDAGRPGYGAFKLARPASPAHHRAVLSRIAMPRPPRTVVRRGAGRGPAWLEERSREHKFRFPQSKTRLP